MREKKSGGQHISLCGWSGLTRVAGVEGHEESVKTGVFDNLTDRLDVLGSSACQQRLLPPPPPLLPLAVWCFLH